MTRIILRFPEGDARACGLAFNPARPWLRQEATGTITRHGVSAGLVYVQFDKAPPGQEDMVSALYLVDALKEAARLERKAKRRPTSDLEYLTQKFSPALTA